MRRALVFLVVACSGMAQTRPSGKMMVWFADGAAIEIRTESTAAQAPLSTGGYVSSAPSGEWNRVVLDRKNNVLFAYAIEARKAAAGNVLVRIKPVNAARIRSEHRLRGHKLGDTVPTLTGPREFPPLRAGDSVQVDILQHSVSGEKIYDVLRVSNQPPPSGGSQPKPAGERLSFQEVRIAINGQTVHEAKSTWFTGAAIMLWLPGKGAFYLTLKPVSGYSFQATGSVDHNVLRFPAGGDAIEITSKGNVLPSADYGSVWVYNDPASAARAAEAEKIRRVIGAAEMERMRQALAEARRIYSPGHPDVLALQKKIGDLDRSLSISCADDVEWLIKNNR